MKFDQPSCLPAPFDILLNLFGKKLRTLFDICSTYLARSCRSALFDILHNIFGKKLLAPFDILLNLFGKKLLALFDIGSALILELEPDGLLGIEGGMGPSSGFFELLSAVKLGKYLETYVERYIWPKHHSQPTFYRHRKPQSSSS